MTLIKLLEDGRRILKFCSLIIIFIFNSGDIYTDLISYEIKKKKGFVWKFRRKQRALGVKNTWKNGEIFHIF